MSHSALSASSHITFFFLSLLGNHPWKRPLTQQPIGPKRQRGEKGQRFIHSPFIPLHPPCQLASRLSVLFFSSRFLVLFFGRIAMARFGFLSLALFSLQALIGTGFAAVCLWLHFVFSPHSSVNCFANTMFLLIRTLRRMREKERKHQSWLCRRRRLSLMLRSSA